MSDTATATLTDFQTATAKTFPWHELYVGDAEAGRRFYTEALGWGKEDYDMGQMKYPMLSANGSAICGVMATNTPEMKDVPPHWAVYIGVDDVDARLAKCTGLGAKVVVPPMDVPTVGRMALIQDPQGAHFWIFKSAN
ncbi:MAG: VOC family protein [Fimbriimonas ginsengisoli]|uniref:VOC family protein n=1 Tax=Fimbriimonas ginsengisoli TaxID=1005039 RepID=A0A931LV49_FIMGI|nr:VOC family protein [Fimbriimonas ginsengisoli]MBI3721575.1 VOC family protein [Fimbriimonas ginsengisoli]